VTRKKKDLGKSKSKAKKNILPIANTKLTISMARHAKGVVKQTGRGRNL
jgi:hypothetical protein